MTPSGESYSVINRRWATIQVNAYCQGCGRSWHGSTRASDAGQGHVVAQVRQHVRESGHRVQIERAQMREAIARASDA